MREPEGDSGRLPSDSRLPEEDVLSLHGEAALTGRLTFEPRPSWTGSPIEDHSEDPLVGTTLHDTYFVTRVLGEGGMGRVYEARHTRIASKRYAIKVLHAEYARNPEIRRRFQHEAEAAAKIEHLGVVGTYDVGETPSSGPYMVSEYLEGEDLNDYLSKGGALSARTVVHIGRQLCSALGEAHKNGIIHRDLKPHNVFVLSEAGVLSEDGVLSEGRKKSEQLLELPTVKVLDFGLSRFVERDADLTKTGIILGTPGYMAPEQAGGLSTDHRTDIYGIGALLYASATGRAPFKEDSPQKTVLSVLRQAPPRPRDLVPSIPIALEIIIQRAMARSPEERYQSAEEVGLALAELDSSLFSVEGASKARGMTSGSPRLELVLCAGAGLFLSLPAFGLATLSLLRVLGVDYLGFRPSALEGLLFSLLTLVLLFPLGLLLRYVQREIWNDSARVAALLPKLKGPLLAGTLAYGVTALVLLSAWGVRSLWTESPVHGSLTPGVYVVLLLNALLAASAVLVREISRKWQSPFSRALFGMGYTAGASVAGLVLLVMVAFATFRGSPEGDRKVTASLNATTTADQETVNQGPDTPQLRSASPTPESKPKDTVSQDTVSTSQEAVPRKRATASELAEGQARGPEALEQLLLKYPEDGRILKALVLAHASRADTLDRSVEAISRLFKVEHAFLRDAEVLFLLKKGILAHGSAHKAAFSILRDQMGTEGGELIYQLLTENPKQQSRLKDVFFALRKADRVAPATAIAYDLRYTTSCQGRLGLLSRAEQDGDLRSVHQLQALALAPKRCGWGKTCKPVCPVEAKQFRKSIDVIQTRLDGRK